MINLSTIKDQCQLVQFFLTATEETMTLLVNSLIDDEHPLSVEAINRIQIAHVLDDIRGLISKSHIRVKHNILYQHSIYLFIVRLFLFLRWQSHAVTSANAE